MGANSIELYEANDKTIRFRTVDSSGAAVDSTGWRAYFTVKVKVTDDAEVISKDSDVAGEIDFISDALNNLWGVNLVPDDTKGVATGTYWYDFEIWTDDSTPLHYTCVVDTFVLKQKVKDNPA